MRYAKIIVAGAMVGLGVLGGCGDDNRIPTPSPSPPPIDTPAPPPFDGTTGRWYNKCYQVGGVVEIPVDLRMATVQALIPDDSASGYRVIAGEGKEDGTVQIPGVPAGTPYLLQLDSAFYLTDQRVISAFFESWGRCSPAPAVSDAETRVTFNLTNMTPFTANSGPNPSDAIEVTTSTGFASSQISAFSLFDPDGTVRIGDTALAATIDWNLEFDKSLPSAAYQDELRVSHRRFTPLLDASQRRTTVDSLVSLFRTTSVTVQNGMAAVVSGAFTPLVQDRMLSFALDRSTFAGSDPLIQHGLFTVEIVTEDQQRVVGVDFRSGSGNQMITLPSTPFADPFPMDMPRFSIVTSRGSRWFAVPGTDGSSRGGISVSNVQVRPFPGAIGPDSTLRAPVNVQISGGDFSRGGKLPFDGQAPISIRWDAVPTANHYRVTARSFGRENESFFSFRTAGTELKLPASAFEREKFYAFSVSAYRAANDYAKGEILVTGLSNQADVASGRFRLTSQCGDGVVQAGEDCDTRGESATCNVDCTAPACGDSIFNAAAGESCDSGASGDTPGCDENCTLPVCGDGELNDFLEDCDDGNATDDGDGCSASCKRNNVCGNNVVESAFEFCDAGGVDTENCDADCSPPNCGDGYHNANREECDDGFVYLSRCSQQCTLLPRP